MPQERTPSLQDTFLGHVRENSVPLTVFLTNGINLQGYITHFDNYGVVCKRKRGPKPPFEPDQPASRRPLPEPVLFLV